VGRAVLNTYRGNVAPCRWLLPPVRMVLTQQMLLHPREGWPEIRPAKPAIALPKLVDLPAAAA
jgi:hypothetical protein